MCTPTLGLMAASTLMSAYSAKQQGDAQHQAAIAQQQQLNYSAGVDAYNARVQKNQATMTRNRGVQAENIQRNKVAQLVSSQRAQLGAAGADVNVGSALDIQQNSLDLGNADALRIRSNYQNQANAYDQQGNLLLSNSNAKRNTIVPIPNNGSTAAFGSILSGGAKIASSPVAQSWFKSNSAAVH